MLKYTLFFVLLSHLSWGQQNLYAPNDHVMTQGQLTINGKNIVYSAETGMQPVWNEQNEPIASLFYTYYKRTDIKNTAERPLVFSFNGGPGSASVWMHIAYTGPKILNIDDEGYPIQPYGVKDNPHSILDVADIVYINPVNTAYSKMILKDGKEPDRKQFFGMQADIKYLAAWMNTFVTRHQRWTSPKFLIGESYGGARVMGLSEELQNNQWMYLNGVILVSPADYQVLRVESPVSASLNLPYYTATAWYHKKLSAEFMQKDLLAILPEVEKYALEILIPALAKGSFISADEKNSIAKQISRFTGITEEVILQHHLNLPPSYFWKELLRKEGKTLGRLDSRYMGIDRIEAGSSPDYNAELDSWLHSFTPAINYYIQEVLNFKTDVPYRMFGDVRPWEFDRLNTREDLRKAMAQNPYLKVLFQSGYYDGATTYFNAKYTQSQIDPSGKMSDRIFFKGYRSGHMMYLRSEDLKNANQDLRNFIIDALPKGKSAKYE